MTETARRSSRRGVFAAFPSAIVPASIGITRIRTGHRRADLARLFGLSIEDDDEDAPRRIGAGAGESEIPLVLHEEGAPTAAVMPGNELIRGWWPATRRRQFHCAPLPVRPRAATDCALNAANARNYRLAFVATRHHASISSLAPTADCSNAPRYNRSAAVPGRAHRRPVDFAGLQRWLRAAGKSGLD
jgi:hypothetical protein